jgi:DNA-binding response OmpR family regulator
MLPGGAGLEVCGFLRRAPPWIPILILSAKSQEVDKVEALRLGADDSVTKPVGIAELMARLDPRTVDFHIRSLRKKIERDPEHPFHLRTIYGQGYRLLR